MTTFTRAVEQVDVEYRLSAEAALTRARWSAALATFSALAPAVFTVLALYKLDLVPRTYLLVVLGLLALLAAARVIVGYKQLVRHLSAFGVRMTDDPEDVVMIDTRSGRFDVPRGAIVRVREIAGMLGGLRVELAPGWDGDKDSPELVDVPRGGATFAALREALGTIKPIESARRRSRIVRIVLGAAVVLSIFFLPFFIDDIFGKSKLLAVALVLVVWIGLRFLVRR